MEDSSFGRLVSVLVAPGKTFRSIAQRPTVLVVLLVTTLVAAAVSALIFSKVDGEEMVRAQIEQSGREVSEEEMEGALAVGEGMRYVAPIGVLVAGPVMALLFGAVFLVAFRVQGAELGYKAALSTLLYGMMPTVVKALLIVPVALGREEISAEAAQTNTVLASNLAFLAPPDAGPVALAALSSADVFSLWSIVLLAIGFAIVGRVSTVKAGVTVTLLWLLGVALKVGMASFGA